jgi:hypothetical protein
MSRYLLDSFPCAPSARKIVKAPNLKSNAASVNLDEKEIEQMKANLAVPHPMGKFNARMPVRSMIGLLLPPPALAGAFVLSGLFLCPLDSSAAGPVTINGAQTYQVIDGFGVNANSLSWTNTDLVPVLNALIDQAGMTLFQVIVENSNWEATNDNGDANVMNWAYYNTVYNSTDFQKLWGMMAYLNQRGITNGLIPKVGGPVALWMGGLTLKSGYENEYAETIASMLVYARNTQHLQFSEVRAVNEPDIQYSGVSMSGSAQEVTVMHDLGLLLDSNGMSDVRFSGPDLAYASSATSWMSAMMGDSYLMSKVAHYGVHAYLNETSDATGIYQFIKQSAYPNTPFWMTEYNVWCPSCLYTTYGASGNNTWDYARGSASYLLTLLGEGASAGIVFEAYDSQYYGYDPSTGLSTPVNWSYWGLLAVDNTNAIPKTYTPRKGFYTLAQISKFVRPGAQRIGVSNSPASLTMLAFYNTNNTQFTITGVNTNSTAVGFSCTLASLPAIPALNLYYTSSTTNLCLGAQVGVTNGAFSVTVPADCVFTLSYSNTPSFFLTPTMHNGNVSLSLSGAAGSTYQIQSSTNLTSWASLTNITDTNGTVQFIDANTNIFLRRYYRAVLTN